MPSAQRSKTSHFIVFNRETYLSCRICCYGGYCLVGSYLWTDVLTTRNQTNIPRKILKIKCLSLKIEFLYLSTIYKFDSCFNFFLLFIKHRFANTILSFFSKSNNVDNMKNIEKGLEMNESK